MLANVGWKWRSVEGMWLLKNTISSGSGRSDNKEQPDGGGRLWEEGVVGLGWEQRTRARARKERSRHDKAEEMNEGRQTKIDDLYQEQADN